MKAEDFLEKLKDKSYVKGLKITYSFEGKPNIRGYIMNILSRIIDKRGSIVKKDGSYEMHLWGKIARDVIKLELKGKKDISLFN